jgi:hypothetical protein
MSAVLTGVALGRASAVSSFIQGEVLAVPDACAVVADAAYPLCEATSTYAQTVGVSNGLIAVPQVVDQVVVLTQTCDLQETTSGEFRCLVAPVVKVPAGFAEDVLRGRRPNYVALPWLEPESIADLTLVTTVERSVLVEAASLARPNTPDERVHFANSIARSLVRPALPEHLSRLLKPFAARFRDRYDRNSPEGACLHHVLCARIEADPNLDQEGAALNVLLIVETTELPMLPKGRQPSEERIDALLREEIPVIATAVLDAGQDPVAKREAWTALRQKWLAPSLEALPDQPLAGSLTITVMNGKELDYERSERAPELDFHYLSTRPLRQRYPSLDR